jgi:hypothetical protein
MTTSPPLQTYEQLERRKQADPAWQKYWAWEEQQKEKKRKADEQAEAENAAANEAIRKRPRQGAARGGAAPLNQRGAPLAPRKTLVGY